MRPALKPGLLPLWRDIDTVQIGVDPRRAVAIGGMRKAAEVIRLLDGSRERDRLIGEAAERGVPAAVTERILTLLAAAGVLIDYPAATLRSMPPELRAHLVPELTAISLTGRQGDGGATVLARRAAARIQVHGSGPLAVAIAELLTCSGIAALTVPEPTTRRESASPDLAVLTGRVTPEFAADLHRMRIPHLVVSASEAIGTVGPLVRPGVTGCLRCMDLTRAERDPAWPLILAQLGRRADEGPAAVLAAAVAAQCTAQAVAYTDRAALAEATANATLELVLPAWRWRRRTWPPHPACTCAAAVAFSRGELAVRTSVPTP